MLTIRLDSPVPLTEQIVRGLRRAIARREVVPGDELPPVRQLAADLGVHLNTVARAYRALEADGLLRTVRGRGTRVTADRERSRGSSPEVLGRVGEELLDALADARLAGLCRDAAERLTEGILSELWPDTPRGAAGRTGR